MQACIEATLMTDIRRVDGIVRFIRETFVI